MYVTRAERAKAERWINQNKDVLSDKLADQRATLTAYGVDHSDVVAHPWIVNQSAVVKAIWALEILELEKLLQEHLAKERAKRNNEDSDDEEEDVMSSDEAEDEDKFEEEDDE